MILGIEFKPKYLGIWRIVYKRPAQFFELYKIFIT